MGGYPPRAPAQFDDIRVDPAAMLVTRNGVRVELEPKAFDVLAYLIERPGRLVSKQELIAEVWAGVAVTDNVLTRCIAQVRRGLGDVAKDSRYIETVPTRGYRFIGTLRAPDAALAVEPPPALPATAARAAGWRTRVWWLAGVAALVVFAGVSAWWLSALARREASAAPAAPRLPPPRQVTFSAGLDAYPTFSPDGKLLAYATAVDGAFEIEVRSIVSESRPQRVTSDGNGNVQPRWSPDGQYLAYHSMALGGVWIVPAPGGTPRRVAPYGAGPAWSPDGRTIVYQSSEPSVVEIGATPPPSELLSLDLASGHIGPLTRSGQPVGGHAEPAFSPDGRLIAFLVRFPTTTQIWTMPAGGGSPVRIWDCPSGSCFAPSFLPDGRSLLVPVAGRGYFELPIDAATGERIGEPQLVLSQRGAIGGHLAVSPDGRLLAVADLTLRSHLHTLALDASGAASGEPRVLTSETGRSTTPMFSPDGSRLAFQGRRESFRVLVMNADGTDAVALPLPTGARGGGRPSWVSNEEVAWLVISDPATPIVATRIDTRETRVLRTLGPWAEIASQFIALRVEPGGRQMLYGRDEGTTTSIRMMDMGTGQERRLTPESEAAVFPVTSPDGRWLAYERVDRGSMQLVVAPMVGGPGRQLTDGRGLTWPHSWWADGSRLAVAMRRGSRWSIGWIARESGETRVLFEATRPNQWLRYPAVSPSGDRIVFEQGETFGNIWLVPRQSTERQNGTS